MEERFDLIVIGSGPGGYVAAIKAAKLGMKTCIIESREIGGTCLNRGCIPTKTLMHSSHFYREAQSFGEAGIHFDGLSFDMEELQNRKEEVVQKIRQGIISLLEGNGVTIFRGTATIIKANQVLFRSWAMKEAPPVDSEEILLLGDKILVATGSKPAVPGIEGVNCPNVLTSDELLSKSTLYNKLLIIGGGVIGVEFASIYSDLGCEVEIIEAMDRILPNMDKEISQSIAMNLKKKGVSIHTKSRVTRIEESSTGGLRCEYEEKETKKEAIAEGILLSIGRKANTEGLFAPEATPELEGSYLKVDEDFRTSIPGIYAIGDVIRGKQLAHAASAQGIVAVERMKRLTPSIDLAVIPSCIYTSPEVATVGMSEEEAIAAGHLVKTGKYPMLGNAKTLLTRGDRGFIKVIFDDTTDKILGAQLLCDRATDLIGEFATAIVNGLTSKELTRVIRPHPTYCEAVTEAVEDVEGMAIHLIPKRK